jgi:hypothetical protein
VADEEMVPYQIYLSRDDVDFLETEAWRRGHRRGGRKGSPGEVRGNVSALIRDLIAEIRERRERHQEGTDWESLLREDG